MVTYYCNNCGITVNKSECSVCSARTELQSKLFWCSSCNIPIYEEKCGVCNNIGEYFTSDARPVFPEERLLLEILIEKPLCFINDSVWNSTGNRYFVNGKKIPFTLSKLANKKISDIRNSLNHYRELNSSNSFYLYIERWIEANFKHYNYITTEAKQYISNQTKQTFIDSNALFVSFSGGKDSTVVSDLVRKALANPSIIHIFGDTTLEFPQTYEYIECFRNENRKTPLLRAKNNEQNFFNLCKTFGPPSRALRWCCTIFKTGFIGEKINKTFNNNKTVLTYYGIRRNESTSRNKYSRSSEESKISKQLVRSPIIDWNDYDIWLYILSTGISFNNAYRLGYTRVGCWCCPNNSKWSQFLSSVYMPEQTEIFNKILLDFATKMGKEDPEDYVSSGGWKARQGGAGIELSKNVVIDFTPCVNDSKSFNYTLNKPILSDIYEFFKPFGKLNFDMGKKRLGEVYVLDASNNLPLLKLQGKIDTDVLKITILHTPIANRTKIIEIELKFKCQITKYQLCVGCHACENVCRSGAIKLEKRSARDSDYKYTIDDDLCTRCFECINHFDGGCYMRRILLPRGKGYSA